MLSNFLISNFDMVYLVYGLSFVLMGMAILLQPRKGSTFAISNIMWLLAAFGLTHGLNEWLDMAAIIKNISSNSYNMIRLALLSISYLFLFEFGRRLLSFRYKKLSNNWFTFCLCIVTLIFIFASKPEKSIWPRYFLGLPGGLFSALGFFCYYYDNKTILAPLKTHSYFFIAAGFIGAYGLLGGLVVPKADFFPASILNTESFTSLFGVPVQVFRTVCSIALAWSIWNILDIFNWEIQNKLKISLQSEKMAAVGLMAATVAHEIRNPLATIQAQLYMLKNYADKKYEQELNQSVSVMNKKITETNEIINDLLNYSRIKKPHTSNTNINILVEEVLSSIKLGFMDYNVRVEKKLAALPDIEVDRTQIFAALHNLIKNAYEAMDKGGKLTISTKYFKDENMVEIEIADTGCGIPEEDISRVGGPFFTTKEHGTGLGLAFVFRVISENHRGTINVKSKLGEGTTFKIRLPKNSSQ